MSLTSENGGMVMPVGPMYGNGGFGGAWGGDGAWWIILLIYSTVLSMTVYAIYRYREITEIRGFFTKEEFDKEFKKELWLIHFMDRAHILIH